MTELERWRCRQGHGTYVLAACFTDRGLIECPVCVTQGMIGTLERVLPPSSPTHERPCGECERFRPGPGQGRTPDRAGRCLRDNAPRRVHTQVRILTGVPRCFSPQVLEPSLIERLEKLLDRQ